MTPAVSTAAEAARRPTPPSHAQRNAAGEAMSGGPPLTLGKDADLVNACLKLGGFPTAVGTRIGTIWVGPDGLPWKGAVRA